VPEETYEERTLELQAEDRLLLYTDGVPEAFNPEGELFGTSRLDAAAAQPGESAGAIVERVLAELAAFTAEGALTDDRTLLALVLA
jgi:sigma-B regulation protein RsbU (phosphoserine phosphatase)